jgi:site-specific DNA recombinase
VQLDRENVRSKSWVTRTGARLGGVAFARGALYDLLRNRLYIGEIRHRDQCYPGEHKGVVPRDLWEKVQAQLNSNLRTRRKRAREQASSLLTGLVEDAAGNRFTPSFTIRRGRRYRYYVSQLTSKIHGGERDGSTRVPAHELESRVTEKLLAFLKSDADVFDRLSSGDESPALSRNLVTAAKKLASRLPSLPAGDLRDLLIAFLQRVIIQENSIEVRIRRKDLRQLLESGGNVLAGDSLHGEKATDVHDLIGLSIEAKRKRFGGEIHLVVPPNSNLAIAHPKPSLIKAIARAHGWYEKVIQGNPLDMRSLAQQVGLTVRYVGKVFQCALLAPDIIESILDGRQPYDLTFAKLCQHVPLSWAEQRERFGFPPVPSQPS